MSAWKIFAAIAGTALILTACGGTKSDTGDTGGCLAKGGSQATAGKTVRLLSDPNTVGKFDPKDLTVKVGDAVQWDWVDADNQHTVTSDDNTFDSCLIGKGSKFIVTFTKAGKVAYRCTIHAQMIGTVTVS